MTTTFIKKLTGTLATVCLVGGSCCPAMVCAQQLQPMQSPVPAQSSPDDSAKEFLPPIIRAADMRSAPASENQAVKKTSGEMAMAPAVSVDSMIQRQEAGTPETPGTPEMFRGHNFPVDARDRIARFISENGQSEVQQTAFSPQSMNASDASWSIAPPAWQESSPSDSPMANSPSVNDSLIFNPPGINTPTQPGMAYTPEAFSYGPGSSFESRSVRPPAEPYAYGDAGVAYGDAGVGNRSWFDPAGPHGTSGHYGSDWEAANQDYGSCADTFACCGFVCDASRYLIVDALYWTRENGTFAAGNFANVDDFDWQWGGRITYGNRRDCTRGWEASYMQFDPWIAVNSQRDALGRLQGGLFGSATGGLGPATVSSFRNATFLEQFQKSDLNSAEINRTWWGSDVAKAFIGGRFIYFDDQFRLSSGNRFGETGIHTIDATNRLAGIHAGGEFLYDIGYRLSFSGLVKIGGYANFFDGEQTMFNNGTFHVFNRDDQTDFAASAELGAEARYRIGPHCRLRAGYEFLALLDVFDVESNYSTVILPTAGQNFQEGGALFHGVNVGVEFYR